GEFDKQQGSRGFPENRERGRRQEIVLSSKLNEDWGGRKERRTERRKEAKLDLSRRLPTRSRPPPPPTLACANAFISRLQCSFTACVPLPRHRLVMSTTSHPPPSSSSPAGDFQGFLLLFHLLHLLHLRILR